MKEEMSKTLDLFYKSVRGLSKENLFQLLDNAILENMVNTVVLCFYIRDCQGRGERQLGRWCFEWMARYHSNVFLKVFKHISFFGRWDDLLEIDCTRSLPFVYQYIKVCLEQDYLNMMIGKPITLLAKWMPSEHKSFYKKDPEAFILLLKVLGLSRKEYRKKVSVLRNYLHIVEQYTCKNEWTNINYEKVPFTAMRNLKKAFEKHDPERFAAYSARTRRVLPHQLIHMCLNDQYTDKIQSEWDNIVNDIIEKQMFTNNVAVCDTSRSMEGRPLNVAIAMTILITKMSSFKSGFITFSNTPEFVQYNQDDTLNNIVQHILHTSWEMQVNLLRVYELILSTAIAQTASPDVLPKKIFILSDMHYYAATTVMSTHDMKQMLQMYRKHGYETLPKIIFWNVRGKTNNVPFSVNELGATLLYGFSHMKTILSNNSPQTFLNILTSPRYDRIRNELLV